MESIIKVAQELDAKIIVEFVSSKEFMQRIQNMDIGYAQGYYIGIPSEQLQA